MLNNPLLVAGKILRARCNYPISNYKATKSVKYFVILFFKTIFV